MALASERHWSSFAGHVRRLDSTRRRIDGLAASGALSRPAAEQMYESLFLGCFTSFEVFLEEAFLALLVPPPGSRISARARPRINVKSLSIARELVVGPGKKYADWIPFDRTLNKAELFFRGGRPFAELTQPGRDLVAKASVIRNAIAHRSRYSELEFETRIIAGAPLPPRERRPGGYLRGSITATPPLTRYENYATALLTVARSFT